MSSKNTPTKYSLFVIKPDAMNQVLDPLMIEDLENKGLMIIKRKIVKFTSEQADHLYAEKRNYNYFPLLVNFMSSDPCLCLILRCDTGGDAVHEAKNYRDWARLNLKMKHFELTTEDVRLLSEGIHPDQVEITRVMALENLIHVSDDFCGQTPLLGELFTYDDIAELRDREPELGKILLEAKEEIRKGKEAELFSLSAERR